MTKYDIEKRPPEVCRVPENIPPKTLYRCIVADPPWTRGQTSGDSKYGSARNHYPLMSLERIKEMPVADLAADNAYLWLWTTNAGIGDALEVVKAWGFRQVGIFTWVKPKLGLGGHLRNGTEQCILAVRGKMTPKCKTQINWLFSYPTAHSEKPREVVSIIERVSPGPYLELFCRRRPASTEKWDCWGNETEGGADIFIPGYPVPKYSFENEKEPSTQQPAKAEASNQKGVL